MGNNVDLKRVFETKLKRVLLVAKRTALEAQNLAKELQGVGQLERGSREGLQTNAQGWINRTMMAVNGIQANAYKEGTSIVIELFNTIDYAKYLELANDRKYELLRPVLFSFKDSFLERAQEVMKTDGGV
jgi:hypothetical protein